MCLDRTAVGFPAFGIVAEQELAPTTLAFRTIVIHSDPDAIDVFWVDPLAGASGLYC